MAQNEYTRQAIEALNMAKKMAEKFHHPYIGTEHLLLGLKKIYTGVAGQVLEKNKLDEEQIMTAVELLLSVPDNQKAIKKPIENSPRLEYILEESRNEAN